MKKLIPIIGLLGTAAVVTPVTVSCSQEQIEIPTLDCTSNKIFTTNELGEYTLNFTYSGANESIPCAYPVRVDEEQGYEPRVIINGGTLVEKNKFSLSITIEEDPGTPVSFTLRILVIEKEQCLWYEQTGFVGTVGE